MPGSIVLAWPIDHFSRSENRPVGEYLDVPGNILLHLHESRYYHLVAFTDAHQAFIEGPVAEPAQGKAIAREVVVAFAPRLDMSGFDHSVTVWRHHPDSAHGAPVLVQLHDGPSETLIPNLCLLRRPPLLSALL